VLQVWFGGQELGNALADVLLGEREPGGRLPHSIPHRLEDVPAWLGYPGEGGQVRYTDGVFVGYRGFDELDREPRYCFGHGLTYTSFGFEGLEVVTGADGSARAEVTVRNTGERDGSAVVQVYVGQEQAPVRRPPHELAGFARVDVAAGGSSRVAVPLDDRAFDHVDPRSGAWVEGSGRFEVAAGASSRDLPLRTTVER
jgi:beta-glucosidase